MPTSRRPVLSFGPFELVTAPPALFRNEQPVSITPKALATLILLAGRPGKGISKEELLSTVWPDTVVEEASLSQNIYTLRKLLSPDFPDQNPIENIPRFGYRFNLSVSEELQEAPESEPLDPSRGSSPPHGSLAEVADGNSENNQANELVQEEAPARETVRVNRPPVRTRNGWIGSMIAFALLVAISVYWQWHGIWSLLHPTPHFDITRFTSNLNEDKVTAVALAPDGKLIAYADADGVVLRGTEDEALHLLPSPPMKVINQLAWFPDQLHLLVSGVNSSGTAEVWKVSVLREPAVLFRSDAQLAMPSHLGTSVALVAGGGTELWVMGPNGEASHRVATAESGARFSVLLWNLHDNGLAVQRRPAQLFTGGAEQNLSSASPIEYEQIRVSDGVVTAREPNLLMGDACLTANGELIYSNVTLEMGQESELLRTARMDDTTGALGEQRDLFRTPRIDPHFFGFSCTAAGDRIAVVRIQGAIGVFVGELGKDNSTLSNTKRLSLDSDVAYAHGWTRDSRSVLYEAMRTQGKWQIFSQAPDRHDPELIVSMNGSQTRPVLSPDGKWILFNYQDEKYGPRAVYRISPEGGMPSAVPNVPVGPGHFRCPTNGSTCVLFSAEESHGGTFFALDPTQGLGRELFRLPSSLRNLMDWDLSPDGTTLVLYTQTTPEPLHTVTLANGEVKAIPFQPANPLKTVNWAARGQGFFVATAAPSGDDLSFLDLHGKMKLLRTTSTSTWAVPSPDGKYISFNDRNLDSNVWLLQKR